MSIVTDARTYADSALEQGKSTITFAQGRLVSLTSDARERATSVATDTKGLALGAVNLARRQAYAAIGVTDAIFASITRRTEELPAETRRSAGKLVDTTKARLTSAGDLAESLSAKSQALVEKAQDKVLAVAGELKERSEEVVESARHIDLAASTATAKDEVESRVEQVKTTFGKLVDRGEKVAADLREEPIVARVIGDADKVVEKAANEVTSVAQKVRARASSSSATTEAPAPVKTTPAPAPVRAPVVKAPAAKAPAAKAPAAKAPAAKAPGTKAPGTKAPVKATPGTKPAAQ